MLIRFIFKNRKYIETDKESKDINIFDKNRILEMIDKSMKKFEIFLNGFLRILDILRYIRKVVGLVFVLWIILFLLSITMKNNTEMQLNENFNDMRSKSYF